MKNIRRAILCIALLVIACAANAAVSDVWFGSDKVASGGNLDVYMSTNGSWYGLNLAFAYTSGISNISFTADSAFLNYIGGEDSVCTNGVGPIATGTGYAWEIMPPSPDATWSQWNGKVGSLCVQGNAGESVSVFTQDGEYNGATAVFDDATGGTWVGESINPANTIKTATVAVPEPGSVLALSSLLGMLGVALRSRRVS